MVDDDVDENVHPALVRLGRELAQLVERPHPSVDQREVLLRVLVVLVVPVLEDGRDPDRAAAEALDVVEARGHADEVAAVAEGHVAHVVVGEEVKIAHHVVGGVAVREPARRAPAVRRGAVRRPCGGGAVRREGHRSVMSW